MIDGTTIHLRPWLEDDLPALTAMRNDVSLQAQLLARARGNRPEQVLEWLQGRSRKSDLMLFIIADRQTDKALGFIQVSDLDPVDRRADLGICLLRQCRGQGLGSKAITLIAAYLRDTWAVRKLCLRVRADNAVAIRCYERNGFERCGCLRQHVFIEGRWHDIILMERFLDGVS